MEIKVITGDINQVRSNVTILDYFEGSEKLEGGIAAADKLLDGAISQLVKQGEIKGKLKEITLIYTLGKMLASKLIIVGLGKRAELTPEKLRSAMADVCKFVRQKSSESVDSVAYGVGVTGLGADIVGQAIAEGALLGSYTFRKHMTKALDNKEIKQFNIMDLDKNRVIVLERGCLKGRIIAQATIIARDMVNEPSNLMTPTDMAGIATQLAQNYNLELKIIEREEMQRSGMGGLLGVAQGSQQPPKFMVLNYKGKNSADIDIALVGKGITFDSGGISIKPSEGMGNMKGDMAGGASVMGAISAVAQLKPQINVMAIIPATENLPSGTAMKPGDIITLMNGKTVEIITTDAEGRLMLADGLIYARKMGAKRLVDVATLTGACHIALGDICTGVFGNNRELIDQIVAAGSESGECMWAMPMNEEYKDANKSDVADIKNSGGRWGGAISAAWFLGEFAENTPWVHLDIAGTSMIDKERGYQVKGSTGVPVRTLINLVLSLAK